jgi:hypothetical protein
LFAIPKILIVPDQKTDVMNVVSNVGQQITGNYKQQLYSASSQNNRKFKTQRTIKNATVTGKHARTSRQTPKQ